MRRLPGARAARPRSDTRGGNGRGEPDDERGDSRLRPRGVQRADARRRRRRERLLGLRPGRGAVRPGRAGGEGPRRPRRVRRPPPEGDREPRPRGTRHARLHAAHGERGRGGRHDRPGHVLGDALVLTGRRAAVPVALRPEPDPPRLHADGHHRRSHGLGGAALLHPCLGFVPPPRGRHEHPHRRRHRGGVPLLGRRDHRPGVLHQPGGEPRRVLRGGDRHRRPGPPRQHARGPGEGADEHRPPRAHRAPAHNRPRRAGRSRGGRPARKRPPRRPRLGPARRAGAGRRRGGERLERGRRVHAHRGTPARVQAAGGHGGRRDGEQDRGVPVPGDHPRLGERAGPDRQTHARGPGIAGPPSRSSPTG